MYSMLKIWTLFEKDEPTIYNDVHDVHTSTSMLLVVFKNGNQIGFYLPNVRRYELIKSSE